MYVSDIYGDVLKLQKHFLESTPPPSVRNSKIFKDPQHVRYCETLKNNNNR